MTTVRELHQQAMSLAQEALVARRENDTTRAESLALQAMEYEVQAASQIPDISDSEPTRSILYRSAASLAMQGRAFATAQRLVAKGLAGYPPPQVEEELKQLFEQINYHAHLAVRGVVLEDNDVQLSLTGNAVGQGDIIYSEFSRRIDRFTGLIDRTLQRLLKYPYRGSGRLPKDAHPFIPVLSTPREGSFAVTVKLALPPNQNVQGQMFVSANQVLEEVLYGITLIEDGRQEDLQHQIQDAAYYRNFVVLARDLAPDGGSISRIGFTTPKAQVVLSKPRADIGALLQVEEEPKLEPIEVMGLLDYANARSVKKKMLGLSVGEGDDKKTFNVQVEKGMEDIVRAYFQQNVIVRGLYDKEKNLITANDIQPADQ